jgi:hypothetical protein
MNGISFSLYDALNKLIIGAIILLPLMVSGWWHTLCQDATTMAFCFTLASFLCGLALWLILATINIKDSKKYCSIDGNKFRRILENLPYWFFVSNCNLILYDTFEEIQSVYPGYHPIFESQKKKCYLAAYYRVQQAGLMGNIPVLEALSEFFKNLVCAVILSSLPLLCFNHQYLCNNIWWYIVAIIVAFAFSIFGRYYTETKIHYLVWEADYFLEINSK